MKHASMGVRRKFEQHKLPTYASYLELLHHNFLLKLGESVNVRGGEYDRVFWNNCHDVWIQFSQTHQKSPSHKNNNVHRCTCQAQSAGHWKKKIPERDLRPKDYENRVKKLGNVLLRSIFTLVKVTLYVGVICTFLYCAIVLHKPTQAIISRNTQDLIYPFMRFFRLVTVPVVRKYPVVTKLYEDSCLVSNPFFTVHDVDCWPCETSRSIVDLTGFSNFSAVYHGSGIPFIVKDAFHSQLGMDNLRTISSSNQELLTKVFQQSTFNNFSEFKNKFETDPDSVLWEETLQIRWRINRVSTVRSLRKFFPKPYFIPNTTEVSVQHFLFVDQYHLRSYSLPRTEFANVFVTQACGTRFIVLIPTDWCKSHCKLLSVVLQPKDVLFYNWLFWRPVSRPVDSASTNLSITYVGSFY